MKIIQIILFTIVCFTGFSQQLYKEKFPTCYINGFCLDCGSVKSDYNGRLDSFIVNYLSQKSINNLNGLIEVQILVDSTGHCCLMSMKNESNFESKKLKFEELFESMNNWKPALKNTTQINASLCFQLIFEKGKLHLKRRSFDQKNTTNSKSVGTPNFKGSPRNELSYGWDVFIKENSQLPWDFTKSIAIEESGIIWIATDNGLVKITQDEWKIYNKENSILKPLKFDSTRTEYINHLGVDSDDTKWIVSGKSVYKFKDEKWEVFDLTNYPFKSIRDLFVNKNKDVYLSTWSGFLKYSNNVWKIYNKENFPLPNDEVVNIYIDSVNRMWIGTKDGNVVIIDDKIIDLNPENSPFNYGVIQKTIEDKNQNIYTAIYKPNSVDNGIYKYSSNSKWSKLLCPRQEIFSKNQVLDMFFDEEKQILWISVVNQGVIAYHVVNNKWEVYTTENSNLPSTNTNKIIKAKDGKIWLSTFAGIARINKY